MTTMPNLPRRAILGAALAAAVAAMAPAGAALATDMVDLDVVDRDTGQALPVWPYQGRLFVTGRPGARYGLRVTNRTGRRVLVVLSVDGVNILTGETAGFDQRGYIFRPYEGYDLNGWRKSDQTIAAFAFAPLSQSYAARTGRPTDVGVIGMAVFYEKLASPPPPQASDSSAEGVTVTGSLIRGVAPTGANLSVYTKENLDRTGLTDMKQELAQVGPVPPPPPPPPPPPSPSTPARPSEKLGTAHGALEYDVLHIEPFERATPYPQFTARIEYDSRANLIAAGVIPSPSAPRRPNPFPAQPGYVPDPPP